MDKQKEYELIAHERLTDCSMFIVDLLYCPLHLHNEIELCYVLQGSLEVSTRTRKIHAKAGDLLLFNSGEAHALCGLDGGARLLALQIATQFCKRYCPQITTIQFHSCLITSHFSPPQLEDTRNAMLRAFEAYLSAGLPDFFECFSLIGHLFSVLLRRVPYHQLGHTEYASLAKKEERLRSILRYMEAHFREPIRLADLTAKVKISETHLSHFFREQLHMTYQEYLTSLRLEAAMHLLKKTDMSLTDIAYESGFSDPKYLKQSFQRRFHILPQKWRENDSAEFHLFQDNDCAMQYILTNEESIQWLTNYLTIYDPNA